MADQAELLARTTEIVSAHLRKNTVPVDQLPALINDIHQTLAGRPTSFHRLPSTTLSGQGASGNG